mmetsp:Transcript_144464/g.462928  ORF Transcript_144464/g.462928 Transcript_144464/m.462928 type:complete len:360 (+) Transcript_144464:120-1199(+)|eukprot:CAMPEP_0203915616 /NCGR_PEP_ID=MMETSP0359-20131031/56405_1 /ASSEMBLY_ACC=CAM_ASM_000338 /TAXON_ID=268821 /ORGANISM="Scrippsiella Hangoei, Strain SHTV-5" /LENGTH=359 /DNA_ID=CAMNT_0050842163 /DNA_START=82 /DNA_END=1161 /DNA_ORIENTATION=-
MAVARRHAGASNVFSRRVGWELPILAAVLLLVSRFLDRESTAFAGGSRAALQLRPRGREGATTARFLKRLREYFRPDLEAKAVLELEALTAEARVQVQQELERLSRGREAVRGAAEQLQDAMAELNEAKMMALDACEVGWEEDENEWGASLKDCADPVLDKSFAAQAALLALDAAQHELGRGCGEAKAAAGSRTAAAEALMEGLDEAARKRLAPKLRLASQPLDEATPLWDLWDLAEQEEVDIALRDLRQLGEEARFEAATFMQTLRERRASRSRAEVAAAAVPELDVAQAEVAASSADAVGASDADAGGRSGALLATAGAALLAVLLYVAAGTEAGLGLLAQLPPAKAAAPATLVDPK